MKTIRFTAYYCGITEKSFAKKVMIYRPSDKYKKKYYYGRDIATDAKVSDIIDRFKADAEKDSGALNGCGIDDLQLNSIYIRTKDALLELQHDKYISDIFSYFSCRSIDFVYIYVAGGASNWFNGYGFIVHPNEDIHRHNPHVHVRRDDNETRYSLDTLTRFPKDEFSREFQRDEKKIILPYLRKNKAKLRRYWDYYMNGYTPPIEDERGRQYYKES